MSETRQESLLNGGVEYLVIAKTTSREQVLREVHGESTEKQKVNMDGER